MTGSHLAERYRLIADSFEAAEVDVACFQEVFTYYHLRQLTKHMSSFRHVSFQPSAAGPAGGLATLSRLSATRSDYHRFPVPSDAVGLPRLTRFIAPLKGTLITTLAHPRMCIVNTHPMANRDGDWSPSNRFSPLHRSQLAALARVIGSLSLPSVVCGDFNIARDSIFYHDFISRTGLADAFKGQCPPTFRSEYLPPGTSPHCIDFILVDGLIRVEAAELLFTSKLPLSTDSGYVSDHIGLRARTLLSG